MKSKQKNNNVTKILVCCHKKCELPKDDIFLPIHVGAAISNETIDIQRDDQVNGLSCNNISNKNKNYCELTALYWAWKNIRTIYPNLGYIGLCHYRRYFYWNNNIFRYITRNFGGLCKHLLKIFLNYKPGYTLVEYDTFIDTPNIKYFLHTNKLLEKSIAKYDIITTRPIKLIGNNFREYFYAMNIYFLNICIDIVKEKFPDYYCPLLKVLNGNKLHSANMLILKLDLLDEYCEFVFGVLFEHEHLLVKKELLLNPDVEKVYSRIPGYLGEILTSTFILKKSKESKIKITTKLRCQ